VKLQSIRGTYDAEGPLATVYLEARSPGEDAEKQVRLRWDALRRELDGAGADEGLLTALDEAVLVEDIGEVQADGRVLVAGRDGVLLDEPWDAAVGAGDAAHLAGQPRLGPYVRERARSVRLLVAIVDQEGAVVRREIAVEDREHPVGPDATVDPDTVESVHKPRGQALSHKQIQRRAADTVQQNARGVAEHLESVAKQWQPDALVLAGEVQGRTAVRDELPSALADICHETESGGTGDDRAEEVLTGSLRDIASGVADDRDRRHRERFEEARARDRVAEGPRAVGHAANLGAVDTVFFGTGPAPENESVILAACARIDADAETLAGPVSDGVAAVLRFEAPDETARGG